MKTLSTLFVISIMLGASTWAAAQAAMLEPSLPLPVGLIVPPAIPLNDYDQDGRTGIAEDLDGDAIYGTLAFVIALVNAGVVPDAGVEIPTSGILTPAVGGMWPAITRRVAIIAAPGTNVIIEIPGQPPVTNALTVGPLPAGEVVALKNLTIQKVDNNGGAAVFVSGNARVLLLDLKIRNVQPAPPGTASGVVVIGPAIGPDAQVVVDGCKVSDCSGVGIYAERASVQIQRTEVSYCGLQGIQADFYGRIDVRDSFIVYNDTGVFLNNAGAVVSIYDCDISHNTGDGIFISNTVPVLPNPLSLNQSKVTLNLGAGINDQAGLGANYVGCSYGWNSFLLNAGAHFVGGITCNAAQNTVVP